MPTYDAPLKQSSPNQGLGQRVGKTFAVGFRRLPQQPMSKAELRALAAQAFANTAAIKPVKKDGGR